jgi:dipeptidyl aminopeptidase/acylaminoacyl peptidase
VFRLNKDKIGKEIPPFINGSYVIWNTRWLSEREVVYTLENNGKPASIQSYNIETKQVTDWTKESLPAQLQGKVKSPQIFKWKSFDQKEISGLYRPPEQTGKEIAGADFRSRRTADSRPSRFQFARPSIGR